MTKNNITLDDFGLPENANQSVNQEKKIFGERVEVPAIFDIVSNPAIRITDIHTRRFNIEKAQEAARRAKEEEDRSTLVEFARFSKTFNDLSDAAQYAAHAFKNMINPIRKNLDYMGISRKVIDIQIMPDGALPIYEGKEEIKNSIVKHLKEDK